MTSNVDDFRFRAFWKEREKKHEISSEQCGTLGAFFNEVNTISSHARVTIVRGSGFQENIGKLLGSKEIFEEDIVEFPGAFRGSPKRHAIIVFDDGAFKLKELDYSLGAPEYMMYHLCKEFIRNVGAIRILGNQYMDEDILEKFKGSKNSGKT